MTGPDDLDVGADLGGVKFTPGQLGQFMASMWYRLLGQVVGHGLTRLAKDLTEDGRIGLLAGMAGHGLEIAVDRQFGVAHGVPQHGPQQGTGQRLVQIGEMVQGDIGTILVQSNLGVGEVLVIDEHEVGNSMTGDGLDGGPWTGDVHLDEFATGEHVVIEVVQPHCQGVRTIGGLPGAGIHRVPHDGEIGDPTVVDVQFGQHGVQT